MSSLFGLNIFILHLTSRDNPKARLCAPSVGEGVPGEAPVPFQSPAIPLADWLRAMVNNELKAPHTPPPHALPQLFQNLGTEMRATQSEAGHWPRRHVSVYCSGSATLHHTKPYTDRQDCCCCCCSVAPVVSASDSAALNPTCVNVPSSL